MLSRDSGRFAVLGIGVISWALTWLALEVAGAGLAAPSEHASKWPRRALSCVVLLGLVFGAGVFLETGGSRQDAAIGQILCCFFLALAGAGAIAERDGWPRELATPGRFKPGAFRLAVSVGVPVLPVTIAGGHQSWPPGRALPRRGRITITYHPLLHPEPGREPRRAAQELAERARGVIEGALACAP